MINPFFINHGPIKISKVLKLLNLNFKVSDEDFEVNDIKDLSNATTNDISFFHSKNIKNLRKLQKHLFA